MASRKPIVLIGGMLWELPGTDGISGAIQPNVAADPNVTTMQPGEITIDSATNTLVVRIGNLVWRFTPDSASSYVGQLNFSQPRNSHWIIGML